MKKDQLFINYYDEFSINRSMSEKEIKSYLSKKQVEINRYKSSTSPDNTETLKELQLAMSHIRDAIKILTRPDSRKQYDLELDAAIREGKVDTRRSEEVRGILERARQFFEQGKYQSALKLAKELVEGGTDTDEPYEIMSRSYYMLGDYDEAVETAEKGSDVFASSVILHWLSIRLLIQLEDYDTAQQKLNKAMSDFAGNAQFAAEQVYLYAHAEKTELMLQTIKSYLTENPNDLDYRRYVANNLFDISNQCYLYDSASDMLLLTEESAFIRCYTLIKLANEIYQDEYLRDELEYVEQFGQMIFDEDHKGLIWFYRIAGVLSAIGGISGIVGGAPSGWIFVGLGLLLELAAGLVKKISYRPYWKIYRDAYRGFKESDDGILYNLLELPWTIIKTILEAFGK